MGAALVLGGGRESAEPPPHAAGGHTQRPENALDALLVELQTFSRPASQLSHVSATGPPPHHLSELGRSASGAQLMVNRAPNMAEIGRKGSVDSSSCLLPAGQSGTLRRLHSYPSGSDTDTSPPLKDDSVPALNNGQDHQAVPPKPPVPERNAELLQLASARRMPPPPPPRTSSRSPLASPTSPQLPPRNPAVQAAIRNRVAAQPPLVKAFSETSNHKVPMIEQPASNSSSCESVNSQEGLQTKKERQEQLEQRHQELLRKQKALQEQYARLQLLQRNASGGTTNAPPVHPPDLLLKKTGSESNLLAKMGLGLATTTSGSMSNIGNGGKAVVATSQTLPRNSTVSVMSTDGVVTTQNSTTTTAKVYETDIL